MSQNVSEFVLVVKAEGCGSESLQFLTKIGDFSQNHFSWRIEEFCEQGDPARAFVADQYPRTAPDDSIRGPKPQSDETENGKTKI